MTLKRVFIFSFLLLIVLGCKKKNKTRYYSFFVAGHTYGSTTGNTTGLHPPFVACFSELNEDNLMKHGFLTGDIVKESNITSWDHVDADLEKLNIPTHFIAGNHEVKNRELYESRYGETYTYFIYENDLFITLDGNLDQWNISGEQLVFLNETFETYQKQVDNIFVFVHQIIFTDYLPLTPNSSEDKAPYLTFETNVLPIFEKSKKPVYLFAGDIGAFDWSPAIYHEKKGNVTYIASGMGGGIKDNYLIVNIFQNKKVRFQLVSLNGKDLGDLENY